MAAAEVEVGLTPLVDPAHADLVEWLSLIGLGSKLDLVVEQGVTKPEEFAELTQEDLEEFSSLMGLKILKRRRFLSAVDEVREVLGSHVKRKNNDDEIKEDIEEGNPAVGDAADDDEYFGVYGITQAQRERFKQLKKRVETIARSKEALVALANDIDAAEERCITELEHRVQAAIQSLLAQQKAVESDVEENCNKLRQQVSEAVKRIPQAEEVCSTALETCDGIISEIKGLSPITRRDQQQALAKDLVKIVDKALEFEAFGVHMSADSPFELRFSDTFEKIAVVPGDHEVEGEGEGAPGIGRPKDEHQNEEPLMKVESFVSLFRLNAPFKKFVYESDFDENGIVYYIGTKCGKSGSFSNPIDAGDITVTNAQGPVTGSLKDVMSRNPQVSLYLSGQNSMYEFDFGERFSILPTKYTLQHGYTAQEYLRSWTLEGSVDRKKWVLLREHIDDTTLTGSYARGSWDINPKGKRSCRYFRVTATGPTSDGTEYSCVGGFEIYGSLFEGERSE